MTNSPHPQAHDQLVDAQFGPRAQAYVTSAVHSQGADLDALEAIARRERPARALDLGTGGGHVAYRLAPHVGEMTAVDLSPGMLAAVRATAQEKGLANLRTVECPAERLPFEGGQFDLLACRFSAHHWRDMEAGLPEARRALRPGATAIFIDACAPAAAALDTHLQAVELLRDPSHVRDYSVSEWVAALNRAGFAPQALKTWQLRMDFPIWTARMATPPESVDAIRTLQRGAARETKMHFAIEDDGSFLLDVLMIEAVAV